MDGVQFVLHNPVYETVYSWGWSWSAIFFFVMAAFSLALMIFFIIKVDAIFYLAFIFPMFLAFLFGIDEASVATETKEYLYSTYEVVLHDNVDYKAFIEKYEILEVNGDFYTIKERDSYGKTD